MTLSSSGWVPVEDNIFSGKINSGLLFQDLFTFLWVDNKSPFLYCSTWIGVAILFWLTSLLLAVISF